jgi:cysteinyl-tRNA synthetase
MTIKLYNSKTRQKQDFVPLDPTNVRMYVCGPTVYDRAHLGNARPVLVFDVLYRLLRHTYGPEAVTYVRNFTDVDDKINASALARQQGGDPRPLEALIAERTDETIAWYHADMDALGALRPNHEPRATGFIGPMITMIEKLIASDHAYAANGHVLFRVRSYQNYGALSGRSVDDMIAGARVEVAPFKEDPMDFVLWKPSSAQEPGWDSPWGRGRPGWHIECSAMSYELLGDTFDIHGGGLDLQFPHHENELAQSCCAHPSGGFAQVWMHNEMLQVEGKKMSKSLGNFFTVRDLLDKGYAGEVIRFVMLSTHYRKPMDWTEAKVEQAVSMLTKWSGVILRYNDLASEVEQHGGKWAHPNVVGALADDLNCSQAITELNQQFRAMFDDVSGVDSNAQEAQVGAALSFLSGVYLLGIDLKKYMKSASFMPQKERDELSAVYDKIKLRDCKDQLEALRTQAQSTKDFSQLDAFKAALTAAGVEVRMSKAGVELIPTASFNPAKLDALL